MKIDFSRMKEGKNGALASFGFMTMNTEHNFFVLFYSKGLLSLLFSWCSDAYYFVKSSLYR